MAIIPAAGSGIRMESKRAKQFLSLDGKPILALTLEPFQESTVDAIILVVPLDDLEYCKKEIVERFGFTKVKKIAPGENGGRILSGLVLRPQRASMILS